MNVVLEAQGSLMAAALSTNGGWKATVGAPRRKKMPLPTVTAPVKTEASKASILPVTSPVTDGNDEISQRHRLGSAAHVAEQERSSEVP